MIGWGLGNGKRLDKGGDKADLARMRAAWAEQEAGWERFGNGETETGRIQV